jgi:hypothetical protein
MIAFDMLRPPAPFDPSAVAYKDWLHLNILDHDSGAIGLVNTSLHGSPRDPRSLALGTALVHVPDDGWMGNVEVRSLRDIRFGLTNVSLASVAVAIDHRAGLALASAHFPDDRLSATIRAEARSEALDIELPLPLGTGWISWYVVPRLEPHGSLVAGGRRIDLQRASAYHDHNWGRWHWGDDFGWEWGVFQSRTSTPAFVFARTTDREHSCLGPALLMVETSSGRRTFPSHAVSVALSGLLQDPVRRLPGAVAALRSDRASPQLPSRMVITALEGNDRLRLLFDARAAAQLIAADPMRPGYTFLHELVGSFTASGEVLGQEVASSGLAVVEYVD